MHRYRRCAGHRQVRRHRFHQDDSRELDPKGLRVNAAAPGFVETPILAPIPDRVRQHMRKQVAHRLGRPEEIAKVCALLASDEASYVNVAVIEVSAGMTA